MKASERAGPDPSQAQEAAEPKLPALSWGALLGTNLKVLCGAACLIAVAWALWLLLAKLFPDTAWLQAGH